MPDRIKNILVNELEIDKTEVEYMSSNEIFDAILNYEGLCGYGTWIRNLVSEVYGVQLDD